MLLSTFGRVQVPHSDARILTSSSLQRSSCPQSSTVFSRHCQTGASVVTAHKQRLHASRSRRVGRLITCKAEEKPHTVICFGEALFDCLADQKGVPKEEVKSWTPYPGGAPANVACALAQLGTKVVFIGNLGQDDLGDQMHDLLAGRGIDLSAVKRTSAPTRDVLVVRSTDGDRTFSGFGEAAANEYADCFIDEKQLPEEVLRKADILVTGTLGLAYPKTAAAMRRAVELARTSGQCAVLVDVNWRPVFFEDEGDAKSVIVPYVLEADMVKVTEEEAEWLFGIPGDDALEHPEKVLEKLPQARGVLVTAGANGSSYAFKGAGGKIDLTGRVPVLKVDVLDTTGAGDGFLGGFLHHVLKVGGLNAIASDAEELRKAVEFGTACGAYVTQGPGAIAPQPTEADVEEFLTRDQGARDWDTPPRQYFDLKV